MGANLTGMKQRGYTVGDLKKSKVAAINQDIIEQLEGTHKKKRSKYGNRKTEVNGITFDSEKEANRYKALILMLKVGEIGLLRLQVEYELNPGGHSIKYIADFVYTIASTGEEVVEDVKSNITKRLPVYRMKKKLMEDKYGIIIKEI